MMLNTLVICCLASTTSLAESHAAAQSRPTPSSVPAIASNPPYFGMNADVVWCFKPPEWPQMAVALEDLGVGLLRMPIRWSVVEPRRGEWDFSLMDKAVASVPRHIQILGTLMSVPAWANGKDPQTAEGFYDVYPPKSSADWGRYVEKVVARYKGRVRHWEVWNEQNGVDFYRPLPDVKGYAELLKVAFAAAKRADPGCAVVLGGLQMNGVIPNPWSPVKTPNYLEDLYRAGGRPHFDVCNIHPYVLPDEGAGHMMELIRGTLAVMDRYGDRDKPLWITEVGCGINAKDSEEDQAKLLADTYRLARGEPRIQCVCWFFLRDMAQGLLGPEDSMGLLTMKWRRRPAYAVYRAAARAAVTRPASDKVESR